MTTGTVLLRPETNHATANSSNETAAVRQRLAMIEGRVKGMTTDFMVTHSDAPRFQAAGSRLGSIWLSLSLITAMAKGAQSTVWAMMMEMVMPEALNIESQPSMASAMMMSGMVGGSRASTRKAFLPKKS